MSATIRFGQLRDRGLVLAPDPLRREELGDDDVGPVLPAEAAERGLGDARHGGEEEGHRVGPDGIREPHAVQANGASGAVQREDLTALAAPRRFRGSLRPARRAPTGVREPYDLTEDLDGTA